MPDTIIEPVTINGHDIEKMSREELIAAIRAMAPIVAEIQSNASWVWDDRGETAFADFVRRTEDA